MHNGCGDEPTQSWPIIAFFILWLFSLFGFGVLAAWFCTCKIKNKWLQWLMLILSIPMVGVISTLIVGFIWEFFDPHGTSVF